MTPTQITPPLPGKWLSVQEAIELANRERSIAWHIERGNEEMAAELVQKYWRVKA
jgi:hypothetical protein